MSMPPQPKVVRTWADLKAEFDQLKDYYSRALEAAEDLCLAADMRDETLLSIVLERHSNLKSHAVFTVGKELLPQPKEEGNVHVN